MREDEKKGLIYIVGLCAAVLFGGDYLIKYFYPPQESPQQAYQDENARQRRTAPDADALSSSKQHSEQTVTPLMPAPSIKIVNDKLEGTLSLRGPTLDFLALKDYRASTKDDSPVVLLSKPGTQDSYFVRWDWYPVEGVEGIDLPSSNAVWHADGTTLSPGKPIRLFLGEKGGLQFQHEISLDNDYMFFVRSRVINNTNRPVTLELKGVIERRPPILQNASFLVFEGLIGVLKGSLKEISYDRVEKKGIVQEPQGRGWIGIADKYWLVAFAPMAPFASHFFWNQGAGLMGTESNQTHAMTGSIYRSERLTVPEGQSRELATHLFAGAKNLRLLDMYESKYHIDHLDLAVDFGFFYFLTKPIFYALLHLKDFTGSFAGALLLFTVLLKLLFFPLANRSYRSMARMRKMQPVLEALKARYKDNPQQMGREVMALYRKEKISPLSGFLPILLQFPVFFALYKVLSVSIEMRHAPFWFWIQDLSAPDPTNIFTLFGLLPWSLPSFLHVGVWPLLMGLSMVLQQKMNPPPTDPFQRRMFSYVLPVVFTYMMSQFAAGLVIYWTWSNILSMFQQWWIARSQKASQKV
jgi:YidC/Oxa1 family membrane protein insertase